jgi:capsular exopolysaccharide synthesis family protein
MDDRSLSRSVNGDISRSDWRPPYGVMAPVPYYSMAEGTKPIAYLKTIRARKGTLALLALLGAALGTLAIWRSPYIYQARAYLEVQGINENVLNRREVDLTSATDNTSQSYINTEARLIESGPFLEHVAGVLNAQGTWKPPVTRREIAGALRVRTHEIDRVLDVSVESADPNRAAAIANMIGSEFVHRDLELRMASSKTTSDWLNRELDSMSGKVRSAEAALLDYTGRNNLLIDSEQGSVAEMRLRQVQDDLAKAQADRIAKESLYENLKNGMQGSSRPVPLGDNTLDNYQLQLTTLRKQLAEMEAVYAPGYYKIPPLKAQIAELEKAYTQQRATALARVEADFQTAARREAMLQQKYSAQYQDTATQTNKMVRYNALKNEAELNRKIYAAMLERVKAFDVAAAVQASNIQLIEAAEIPQYPIRPNKPMIAILGGMVFLFGGIVWVVTRAAGNRSIKEPGEAQQYLRSPELGVIPAAAADQYAPIIKKKSNGKVPGDNGMRPGVETVTWHCSPSFMAESFRATSASLLIPKPGRQRPRVLLISSLSPSEGKTTVASNMAIAFAGAAGRTLLIDADRRRARLHRVFGVSNEKGLTELLQNGHDPIDLNDYIHDTAIPNLHLLPSGEGAQQTSDLLYSNRLVDLVEQFRQDYEVVLIDTPPLMHLPDARILGRVSDGVVLVLRAGRVRYESAVAIEDRLREDGIPVIGTVLNDWDPKKNGYGIYPEDKKAYAYFAG